MQLVGESVPSKKTFPERRAKESISVTAAADNCRLYKKLQKPNNTQNFHANTETRSVRTYVTTCVADSLSLVEGGLLKSLDCCNFSFVISSVKMDAHLHPETLEETPPQFLSSWLYLGKSFIEDYGWYLLGSGLLLYYLLQKMRPYIKRWQEQQEERKYAAFCHKNPDLVRARQEAMEVARLRMQVEHDERARIQAEKKKELEARKKEEYLARLEGSGPSRLGHQLSSDQSDSDNKGKKPVKSSHRPDYNPLMGSGGSGGYRPARRTCPGGGCG